MRKKVYWILPALTICALAARPLPAQEQKAATKPDSPEVLAHIEKAKKIAGTYLAQAERFLCEAPRANPTTNPAPVKLFANFWAILLHYAVGSEIISHFPTPSVIMFLDPT